MKITFRIIIQIFLRFAGSWWWGSRFQNQKEDKQDVPFIRSHSSMSIFWHDLAPAHYSKLTMAWYIANNVYCVPKLMNPPNCPELRPIERFWAVVKRNLRKNKNPLQQMKQIYKLSGKKRKICWPELMFKH